MMKCCIIHLMDPAMWCNHAHWSHAHTAYCYICLFQPRPLKITLPCNKTVITGRVMLFAFFCFCFNESLHLLTKVESQGCSWGGWWAYKAHDCHTRDWTSTPESHWRLSLGKQNLLAWERVSKCNDNIPLGSLVHHNKCLKMSLS